VRVAGERSVTRSDGIRCYLNSPQLSAAWVVADSSAVSSKMSTRHEPAGTSAIFRVA